MAALAGGASPPPPPASLKGKAKMVDGAEAEDAGRMCGICYVSERFAIRGELDCCAHYFCFCCIMAWGRVESLCPFCKARFRTIRRPPVPGRFPAERVVSVPERNQVYHPEGNGSSTVGGDPYANTICSVCSCCRDDDLLLLCDLCDLAAHTYCAGLGTVVPEGDWFCKDCAATREEHLRWQAQNEGCSGQGEFQISFDVPRAEQAAATSGSNVADVVSHPSSGNETDVQSSRLSMDDPAPSIYDIVDECHARNSLRSRHKRNAENFPSQDTSSAASQCPVPTQRRDNGFEAYHASIRLDIEKARTLRNSRNLDKRIREMRESWTALRDGSLEFAAHVPYRRRKDTTVTIFPATEHQRYAIPSVSTNKNGAAATSVQLSSMPLPEETSTSLGHGNKFSHKDNCDARMAWKKLEMAKSYSGRKTSNKPSSLSRSPPFSVGNRSTSYSPIDIIIGHKNQNAHKVAQKNNTNCGNGTKMETTPPTKNSRECRSLPENSCAKIHQRVMSFQNRIIQEGLNGEVASSFRDQEGLNGEVASSVHDQHVDPTLESLCGADRLEKFKSDKLSPLKCSLSSGQSTMASSLQLGPRVGNQSTMVVKPEVTSAVCAVATNEIGSAAAMEIKKGSRQDHPERKRKHSSEKCYDEEGKRSKSTCKIAKTEISALAIRELKLLKIDKAHGSDRFKEVARTATHTVLAAFGLEHSASQSLASSRPVCKHSPKVKPPKSSVMSGCCTECLQKFVKETISLVLSARKMDQSVPSC